MTAYFTEAQMFWKESLWAMVSLGGMAEGFDYSEAKALMRYWALMRRKHNYQGGEATDLNAAEAKRYLQQEEELP